MKDDILEHFELDHLPFDKQIDADDLWLPPSKADLVDQMCGAIAARQNVVLTGEPGVGKTCVLRAVRHRLSETDVRLTYCHNATLSRRDFYRQLCIALDLSASATAAALFHAVSTHVTELGRDRIHPVIILDEAHLLRQATLEHLHILLNYGWDSQPLLSLILVGLPELEDRLRLRRHRALYTRLRHRLRIDPLTPADCVDYITRRLTDVGCDADIFTGDATVMICEASHGSLREIARSSRIITGSASSLWPRPHVAAAASSSANSSPMSCREAKMRRSELLEIIDQLDATQTRLAIDLLGAVLDALDRHLRRVDPPDGRAWRDPPWLDAGDDTPAE